MINHFRVSLLAGNITQQAAMAHAYEHSGSKLLAEISREEIAEDFKRMALELGYTIEKAATPKLMVAA